MIPLVFAPDADPMSPGIVVSAQNIVPTIRGYQHALHPTPISGALPAYPMGAAFLRKLNNIPRTFVGTATRLYEFINGWVDQSRVGGYDLVDARWSFRQFGDASLAASPDTIIQQSIAGAFTNVAGSPQGAYLVVSNGFVLLYRLGSYWNGGAWAPGLSHDSWACSALYDQTNWVPAAATQSAWGRVVNTPGPITAAREHDNDVIVFKERSMYRHRYVNVPVVWALECIDSEIGAVCNEAVVDIGNGLAFVGEHDIYVFDGTRPRPIGEGIREWFYSRVRWSLRWQIRGGFDRDRLLVYWWYPSPSGQVDSAIVYHLRTGKWGHVDGVTCQETLSYAIDTGFVGIAEREYFAIITDLKLSKVSVPSPSSVIRLGWMGDDANATTLTELRPRFLRRPQTASATFYTAEDVDAPEDRGPADLVEKAFDCHQNATWHSAEMRFTGAFEITGIANPLPKQGGRR